MKIAVTGGTGFLGRYILERLVAPGHACRCWHRPQSDRGGFHHLAGSIEWLPGTLGDRSAGEQLVRGCQAVVHAALEFPPGVARIGQHFDIDVALRNVQGTLQLIAAAKAAGVDRFVFISSCAVYDRILPDRLLDETHPTWPASHYGAHKAAIEAFVHSYALGEKFPICALRPTGIYGVAHPVERSKWHSLVRAVVAGEAVTCERGGKEVHAADVAKAVEVLLRAPAVAGESYNCYDMYVSEYDVAELARRFAGTKAEIRGSQTRPKNQIVVTKLKSLGMQFGGRAQLEQTIAEMVRSIQEKQSTR